MIAGVQAVRFGVAREATPAALAIEEARLKSLHRQGRLNSFVHRNVIPPILLFLH